MNVGCVNRKFREAQPGFTLIELLVVIAILALLVGLVVPVVSRALASAKVIQALSGIRQCGQFVMAEAAEHNGNIRMHVWGLNYENDPENGVYWEPATVSGYKQKVHVLYFSRVMAPSRYAMLGDSSDINGSPHLRMSRSNAGGRSFALRYHNKGPIFTLDGSAKMIGVDQMENYALQKGYKFKPNNPVTDPELITAY